MGLLDDNIYAQNVALKNQSIGGFKNPFVGRTTPNFSLPQNMSTPQITTPNPASTEPF